MRVFKQGKVDLISPVLDFKRAKGTGHVQPIHCIDYTQQVPRSKAIAVVKAAQTFQSLVLSNRCSFGRNELSGDRTQVGVGLGVG